MWGSSGFPVWKGLFEYSIPPSFAKSAKARNWFVNRASDGVALAHNRATPHACYGRPSSQLSVRDDVEAITGLCERFEAMFYAYPVVTHWHHP